MKKGLNEYLASIHRGAWFGWKDLSAGETYENVKILDKSKTLPSKADCEAGIIALQEEWDAKQLEKQKQTAYQAEADPLFFKWQAGEITEQEWKDKRAEIKARFTE